MAFGGVEGGEGEGDHDGVVMAHAPELDEAEGGPGPGDPAPFFGGREPLPEEPAEEEIGEAGADFHDGEVGGAAEVDEGELEGLEEGAVDGFEVFAIDAGFEEVGEIWFGGAVIVGVEPGGGDTAFPAVAVEIVGEERFNLEGGEAEEEGEPQKKSRANSPIESTHGNERGEI